MAFAAPSSSRPGGVRPSLGSQHSYIGGNHPFCQHCHTLGHIIDRCFSLHLELKQQYHNRPTGRGRGAPHFGAILEMVSIPTSPDLDHI